MRMLQDIFVDRPIQDLPSFAGAVLAFNPALKRDFATSDEEACSDGQFSRIARGHFGRARDGDEYAFLPPNRVAGPRGRESFHPGRGRSSSSLSPDTLTVNEDCLFHTGNRVWNSY